jgi:hypothetical protein
MGPVERLKPMPEEQEKQIERREPGGGIGRRSDIARRGMNAANYVRGLATKWCTFLNQHIISDSQPLVTGSRRYCATTEIR